MTFRDTFRKLVNSIGTKIVFPYVLLTLIVAGIGAFIVTNLVTGTLQERFDNQLLDSGRVVAEIMVDFEQARLSVLRAVAGTEGVSEALSLSDTRTLETLVPQIIANSNTDAIVLINQAGVEVYSWYKGAGPFDESITAGTDFSQFQDVQLVLDGYIDEAGNRRAMLAETPQGFMLFTIGPVFEGSEQVGAALIGSSIDTMVLNLTENAIARVTLYDPQGHVIGTSLATGQADAAEVLQETSEWYQQVTQNAQTQVPTRRINLLSQTYLLAFGDWRLRGQSFGLYSVALPSNFIISAAATSRNSLSLVFSMATVGVFAIGYAISRRIVSPLNQLVQTSAAVTQGNLDQRSGIERGDEIGVLAASFDNMTHTLEIRNHQLIEQASNLEAILQSIADGVIVLDRDNQIVTTNPAAAQILQDVAAEQPPEDATSARILSENETLRVWLAQLTHNTPYHRYEVGNRVFSALLSAVKTPDDTRFGSVVVMRDITREVEAEVRQNTFITNVSHELRTPLTSVKGYVSLLRASGADSLGAQHQQFVEVIDSNTDKLVGHVNRLMDIAEIQTGALQLTRERISFQQIAAETVQAWEEKLQANELTLTLDTGPQAFWILGDTARLSWAIDNLMENASDYTPAGGHVRVRIFASEDQAHLSISDTGIGINATDQPFVFDRFFRVENEMTINNTGMGLGLFITRFIVESHHGNISVDSRTGKGSTFEISIPLEQEQ